MKKIDRKGFFLNSRGRCALPGQPHHKYFPEYGDGAGFKNKYKK